MVRFDVRQAALAGANFYQLHDRKNPPNAIFNVYSTSDDQWFLIVVQNKDWPSLAAAIGRQELLLDARFNDDAKRVANAAALTEILDKVFASQTLDHWRHAFDQAHITYGVVRSPQEVTTDPQLLANDVIVPLEGAGEHLKLTVSSPLTVHGAAKVPARRAPNSVSTMKKSSNSSASAVTRSTAYVRMVRSRTPGMWNRRPEAQDDRHCHRTLRGYPASPVQSAVQEKCDDVGHVHHHGRSPDLCGER